MQAGERLGLEQIRALLEASDEVGFKGQNREEVYRWVGQTLREQRYHELKRCSRGLARRYLEKMTGLSRAQITRLVTMYLEGDPVQLKAYRRKRFPERYSRQDIVLLAALDDAHESISGPATQKLLQRACYDFNDSAYQRLAELSVAQMYRHEKAARTASDEWLINPPSLPKCRSVNGVDQTRRTALGSCEWIQCIRAIWTE